MCVWGYCNSNPNDCCLFISSLPSSSCSIEKLCSQRFQTRGVDAMTSAKYNFRSTEEGRLSST
ncbi:uncharacterized protein [Physcomitrium patens]|uniref:uncharacterized protein isoform X7 n=1 Tax=Physcomitrium patens TaxID=3218 RepID=UPI003CCDF945